MPIRYGFEKRTEDPQTSINLTVGPAGYRSYYSLTTRIGLMNTGISAAESRLFQIDASWPPTWSRSLVTLLPDEVAEEFPHSRLLFGKDESRSDWEARAEWLFRVADEFGVPGLTPYASLSGLCDLFKENRPFPNLRKRCTAFPSALIVAGDVDALRDLLDTMRDLPPRLRGCSAGEFESILNVIRQCLDSGAADEPRAS